MKHLRATVLDLVTKGPTKSALTAYAIGAQYRSGGAATVLGVVRALSSTHLASYASTQYQTGAEVALSRF